MPTTVADRMTENTTTNPAQTNMLLVSAVALIDRDGRVLLAQRPEGKPMAGLWEFPGGKIEPGETPETALIRELDEELGTIPLPHVWPRLALPATAMPPATAVRRSIF